MNFKDLLQSRIFTVLALIMLVLIILFAGKLLVQKRKVDTEIARLQNQAENIKKDNEKLSYLIKYYNTPEFLEKEAREKLNLKKEGEYVVALPRSNTDAENQQNSANKISNPKKWLEYLFKPQSK